MWQPVAAPTSEREMISNKQAKVLFMVLLQAKSQGAILASTSLSNSRAGNRFANKSQAK
jgi:hypothetical protein